MLLRIANLLKLGRDETRHALLLGGILFFMTGSYTLVKTARDALFLAVLPAALLPYVFLGVGALTTLVAVAYARASRRRPTWRSLEDATWAAAISLGLFAYLYGLHARWVPIVFYLWVNAYGLIQLAQFWSFANSVSNPREAKRIFGAIGTGGILGGLFGGAAAAGAGSRGSRGAHPPAVPALRPLAHPGGPVLGAGHDAARLPVQGRDPAARSLAPRAGLVPGLVLHRHQPRRPHHAAVLHPLVAARARGRLVGGGAAGRPGHRSRGDSDRPGFRRGDHHPALGPGDAPLHQPDRRRAVLLPPQAGDPAPRQGADRGGARARRRRARWSPDPRRRARHGVEHLDDRRHGGEPGGGLGDGVAAGAAPLRVRAGREREAHEPGPPSCLGVAPRGEHPRGVLAPAREPLRAAGAARPRDDRGERPRADRRAHRPADEPSVPEGARAGPLTRRRTADAPGERGGRGADRRPRPRGPDRGDARPSGARRGGPDRGARGVPRLGRREPEARRRERHRRVRAAGRRGPGARDPGAVAARRQGGAPHRGGIPRTPSVRNAARLDPAAPL